MSKTILNIIGFLIVIGLIVLGILLWQCRDGECFASEPEVVVIDSFQSCVEAGFPVMESYPRQCRAEDKLFVEDIAGQPIYNDLITVSLPTPNSTVQSPLLIRGEARGMWYFEASFPAKLYDANGNLLGVVPIQAQDDWMTENFVPFEASLEFTTPETETGTLVLEKSNASGLPENDDSYTIPVRF